MAIYGDFFECKNEGKKTAVCGGYASEEYYSSVEVSD